MLLRHWISWISYLIQTHPPSPSRDLFFGNTIKLSRVDQILFYRRQHFLLVNYPCSPMEWDFLYLWVLIGRAWSSYWPVCSDIRRLKSQSNTPYSGLSYWQINTERGRTAGLILPEERETIAWKIVEHLGWVAGWSGEGGSERGEEAINDFQQQQKECEMAGRGGS